MNTFESQRCDYIEVLNSYLKEAATEETEYDVDAIRVRLNFVSQLTAEEFIRNKDYLLDTHPALLRKGLIGIHISNLPSVSTISGLEFDMSLSIKSDDPILALTPERKQALENLLASDIQVTGYALYPSDCAPRLSMYGGKGIVTPVVPDDELPMDEEGNRAEVKMGNRFIGETEKRRWRDLDQRGIADQMVADKMDLFVASFGGALGEESDNSNLSIPPYKIPLPTATLNDILTDPRGGEGLRYLDSEIGLDQTKLDQISKTLGCDPDIMVQHGAINPIVPISHVQLNSLKHHPSIVNEQYRSKAFFHVMPAEHANRLMKNLQVMLNLMDPDDELDYQESVKAEIKRLRYIAEGAIKSHQDVDTKWVD